jgi:hypothetical protein
MTPEQIADEEARAAAWREQQIRRARFQEELWLSLAGDPAAAQALRDAWAPLWMWAIERQEPENDPELEIDPIGISDTVNVGL